MTDIFPAVGTYHVLFTQVGGSGKFFVLLDFSSETSLTYTPARADGTPAGPPETVDIAVEPIRDLLFLVTWKEQSGTTVVHLEDYKNDTIITNITAPTDDAADPQFVTFRGSFTMVS
jgi:hypothetical protein